MGWKTGNTENAPTPNISVDSKIRKPISVGRGEITKQKQSKRPIFDYKNMGQGKRDIVGVQIVSCDVK